MALRCIFCLMYAYMYKYVFRREGFCGKKMML